MRDLSNMELSVCDNMYGIDSLLHNYKFLACALRMVGIALALLGRHKGVGESHAQCHVFLLQHLICTGSPR